MVAAVHHQRPLGVDHTRAAAEGWTRRGCGSMNTGSSGNGGENQPAESLPERTAPGDKTHSSALQNWATVATRVELPIPPAEVREGAMAGTNRGSATNWGGRETTQWCGRFDVCIETPEVHMHTLKIGILDVSNVDGYS